MFVKSHQQPIKYFKKERKTVQNSPLTNLICEAEQHENKGFQLPLLVNKIVTHNYELDSSTWMQHFICPASELLLRHLPLQLTHRPKSALIGTKQQDELFFFFLPRRINKSLVLQIITKFNLSICCNILQCFVSSDFKGNYSLDVHDLKP